MTKYLRIFFYSTLLIVLTPILGYSQFYSIINQPTKKIDLKSVSTKSIINEWIDTKDGYYISYYNYVSTAKRSNRVTLLYYNKKTNSSHFYQLKDFVYERSAYTGSKIKKIEKIIRDSKGRVWLLYSMNIDKKQKLYRQEVIGEKNTLGKSTFITERNLNESGIMNSTLSFGALDIQYKFLQSESLKTLLIITYKNNIQGKCTDVNFEVRDENYTILWRMKTTLDTFNPDQMNFQRKSVFEENNIKLYDNGDFYGISKAQKVNKAKDNFFLLYLFSKENKKLSSHLIRHDDKNIEDLKFTKTLDNKLVISGLYNSKKTRGKNTIEGLYYLNIDLKTKSIITETFTHFTNKHLKDIWVPNERAIWGNEKSFSKLQSKLQKEFDRSKPFLLKDNYKVRDIIPQNNKSYTITFENYNPINETCKGIVYLNINVLGEITWIKNSYRISTHQRISSVHPIKVFNQQHSQLCIYKDEDYLICTEITQDGKQNSIIMQFPMPFLSPYCFQRVLQQNNTFTALVPTKKEKVLNAFSFKINDTNIQ
ncbi:hypothetical protein [Flammeovirga agarivorans]|uniref:Uncharacterized protein n=1 Tax=Flammeovirga agarivorans TaxID=2726742 RepID=A0A7X8XXD5_9BACT|nr:hypothetical protein [Flammeovirga agarivorans]NLR93124.1 hypothetical protein [Flammeovirga agarivorans]